MLPQFGFIVAQAGADSLHPTLNNSMSSSQAPSSKAYPTTTVTPNTNTTTSTNITPTTASNEQAPYYYTRHPSPPACSTPMLPPPLPYMYNAMPPPIAREDYYANKYYPPSVVPQTSYDQQHYRPLQPLPPPTNHAWHPDGAYAVPDPYNNHVWQPPAYHPPAPPPPPPPIQHHPIHVPNNTPSAPPPNDDYYDQPPYSSNRWQGNYYFIS